jgi:hypothetical protein
MNNPIDLIPLFQKITLSPNAPHCNRVCGIVDANLQINKNSFVITHEWIKWYLLARAKVKRLPEICESVKQLIFCLQRYLYDSLLLHPAIKIQMPQLFSGDLFEHSKINDYLEIAGLTECSQLNYTDLFSLLGSDWKVSQELVLDHNFIEHSLIKYYIIISCATECKKALQYDLWNKSGVSSSSFEFAQKLIKDFENKLQPPTIEEVDALKKSSKTLYYPIGNTFKFHFFLSIIAIDYKAEGFRLRILTTDEEPILAAASKDGHYCPEVVFEKLSDKQILNEQLWITLRQIGEFNQSFLKENVDSFEAPAFNSKFLIPFLTKTFGIAPVSKGIIFTEEKWNTRRSHKNRSPQIDGVRFEELNEALSVSGAFCIKGTEKQISKTSNTLKVKKFIHLFALDCLQTTQQRLMYKGETRLILLTLAYEMLRNKLIRSQTKSCYLRLIEESFGKVAAPLEKLFSLNLSGTEKKEALSLLASFVDLKNRIARLCVVDDTISYTPPLSPFSVIHKPLKIDVSALKYSKSSPSIFSKVRMFENRYPLPHAKKWTEENFLTMNCALQAWYDSLLDARHKCEPIEILSMAHENIFSKLPIPQTDQVKDTFPDPFSEGLAAGTLLLINKICSLISEQAFSQKFIPPQTVIDLAVAYRFSLEILRWINPKICNTSISWFALHTYYTSKESFHQIGDVQQPLQSLIHSFSKISPDGYKAPSQDFRKIPIFYFNDYELSAFYENCRTPFFPEKPRGPSVHQVLTFAKLAELLGMKVENSVRHYESDFVRWSNSFFGQCMIASQQIAQFHTVSIFVKPSTYQKVLSLEYYQSELRETLGQQDFFQLNPPKIWKCIQNYCSFEGLGTKFSKQILSKSPTSLHRIVKIQNPKLNEFLLSQFGQRVVEYQSQAKIVKGISKQVTSKQMSDLVEAICGSQHLSLDILLEYFQTRKNLLFSKEFRSLFNALIRSQNGLNQTIQRDPLYLDRLLNFLKALIVEDQSQLQQSIQCYDRLAWISSILRILCRLQEPLATQSKLVLGKLSKSLYESAKDEHILSKIACEVVASYPLVFENDHLPIQAYAKLHLIIGFFPPSLNDEVLLWMDTSSAMSRLAKVIQQNLFHGEKQLRHSLWSLLIKDPNEIEKLMARAPQSFDFGSFNKILTQREVLLKEHSYLKNLCDHYKVSPYADPKWHPSACEMMKTQVSCRLEENHQMFLHSSQNILAGRVEPLFICDETSLLFQTQDHLLSVDWQTGRSVQSNKIRVAGNRLPVFLRLDPNLMPLKKLLLHPVHQLEDQTQVKFDGIEKITLDLTEQAAKFYYQGQTFRLLSDQLFEDLNLPKNLSSNFSFWINQDQTATISGILTVPQSDGNHNPFFYLDNQGFIRSPCNQDIRLAESRYFPELEPFLRWGIQPTEILVWIGKDDQIEELHLPLKVQDKPFVRVERTKEGKWILSDIDIELEPTESCIKPFDGHLVYLKGKNRAGQPLLLLSSNVATKDQKKEKSNDSINWGKILAQGAEFGIHQFKILNEGKIEGFGVEDNLLLMFHLLLIGRYKECVQIGRRWLQPAGRAYIKNEQDILKLWINYTFSYLPLKSEFHPSAVAIKLFVFSKVSHHLRHFPIKEEKEKGNWTLMQTFEDAKYRLNGELLDSKLLKKQLTSTTVANLLSNYEIEQILKLIPKHQFEEPNSFVLDFYLKSQKEKRNPGLSLIASSRGSSLDAMYCQISSNSFTYYAKKYPELTQIQQIPTDFFDSVILFPKFGPYFDACYTLINNEPTQHQDVIVFKKLVHFLENFESLALQYNFQLTTSGYKNSFEFFQEEDSFYLFILREIYFAKRSGKILPELPSLNKHFGLASNESAEKSAHFFQTVLSIIEKDLDTIFTKPLETLREKIACNYALQNECEIPLSATFLQKMNQKWSDELVEATVKWRNLTCEETVKPPFNPILDARDWEFASHANWEKVPQNSMLQTLHGTIEQLQKIVDDRKAELIIAANPLAEKEMEKLLDFARMIHYKEPLGVEESLYSALKGNEKVQHSALKFLDAALELAHLLRAKNALEELNKEGKIQAGYKAFFQMLTTPHRYRPNRENLPIMLTEYFSDCRLRVEPDQAKLIDDLTANVECAIRANMGSGKSKVLAPIWLMIMKNKEKLPILCVPAALYRTTLTDLEEMMWNRFQTPVQGLSFNRESCSYDQLMLFCEKLFLGQKEGACFVTTPKDLHALQLMLKERHQLIYDMTSRLKTHFIAWCKTKNVSEPCLRALRTSSDPERLKGFIEKNIKEIANEFDPWYQSFCNLKKEVDNFFNEANLIQSILNLLQTKGALLIDEAANCLNPKNLLSYPMGWQVPANPHAATVACRLYFEWLTPFYKKLGLLENKQSLSSKEDRLQVWKEVAKSAYLYYSEIITALPHLQVFTDYLISVENRGKVMEEKLFSLHASKSVIERQMAQEIAFLKHCLTDGLEGAFLMTAHVNYGRSKQSPDLAVAIPYQCANVPKENTLFRRPWKTVLMTCQLYLQGWNDPDQTRELLGFIQGLSVVEEASRILVASNAIWKEDFVKSNLSDQQIYELTKKLDQARLNKDLACHAFVLIQTYLKHAIFPTQLKIDPSQLTSSPQDLAAISFTSAMGGTFEFEKTWHPKLNRVYDRSVDEKILKVLMNENNQTCHLLPAGDLSELFKLLQKIPTNGLVAIMDAGAHFKGFCNEDVAIKLLATLKDFDTILFYDDKQESGAQLAILCHKGKIVLESSDKASVKHALEKHNLSKPFAFFDQARCIGADLDLNPGQALVTFSDTVTQDDLFQACMRCRGLLQNKHTVAFVIPEEMRPQEMRPQEIQSAWTTQNILQQAKERQIQLETRANFHGISDQLKGALRNKIDEKLRKETCATKRQELFSQYQLFLLEEQPNDLVLAFGKIDGKISSRVALQVLVEHLLRLTDSFFPDLKDEMHQTFLKILDWHKKQNTSLPEFVATGENQDDATQQVDLSTDYNRLLQLDELYEKMTGSKNPREEIAWSCFDRNKIKESPLCSPFDAGGQPTLFSLNMALKERQFSVTVSPEILISANLLATFTTETNCLITENQKPLHRVLFVAGVQSPTIVLLSEEDAKSLKGHLSVMKGAPSPLTGIYLLEPSGIINQRGNLSENISNLWSEGTPKVRQLLVQILIFQGAALVLDMLPKQQVREALAPLKKSVESQAAWKALFEAALEFKHDDLAHYRRCRELKMLLFN